MRFVGAIVTLIVVGLCGLIGLGVMLVLLNGFSERDGGVAIALYAIVALVVPIGAAALTPLVANRLSRNGKSAPALYAAVVTSLTGCVVLGVGGVGGLLLAIALSGS